MTPRAAVDNDVVIKMACYDLLDIAGSPFGENYKFGVLGEAKFVARSRIDRGPGIHDRDRAKEALERFLQVAEELEPTDNEVSLATELEELAIVEGAELDAGESQLCAIVVTRTLALLVTGDKRAIKGAEMLLLRSNLLAALVGKVLCLEQLVWRMLAMSSAEYLRTRVCSEPEVDRTLSICFGCHGQTRDPAELLVGLNSYIQSIRNTAPSLLYPDELDQDG